MSYNPDTGRIRCDVCESDDLTRTYYGYHRTTPPGERHICKVCLTGGAYWCDRCEAIHDAPGKCPQPELTEPGQEATDG